MGGAADRFWSELQALYQAANKPTLSRLVRLGLEQRPQISISDSTINGWLNGKAVPTGRKNELYLTAMLAFLQARARSTTRYEPPAPGTWGKLLHQAQKERAAGKKNGRPRRPAVSPTVLPDPQQVLNRDLVLGSLPASVSTAGGTQAAAPARCQQPADVDVDTSSNDEHAVTPLGSLVGRDSEIAMLGRLLRTVAAGQGSAVLIEGEPGIGKSALVRAALAAADVAGQVFWGAGDELGQALPLLPLLEALRVHEPSANPRRNKIVRLLRGEDTVHHSMDVSAAVAEQLLALIAEQCAMMPTILVVDDLQWADQASVTLWGRLAKSVRQMPLLLIGMTRPVPQREDLLTLRRAVGDGVRFQLTGLTEAPVAELIAALAGGKPDEKLLQLAEGAAGNPLYVTELIAALTRNSGVTITGAGTAELTSGSVPSSLSAAIADRLNFVSGPVREVLRAAALLGVDFAMPDMAIALDRAVPDLLPAVGEALAAGVLAGSGSDFGFRHPLRRRQCGKRAGR